jgi:pyridoxamine 5'-phosphate oxidase
MHPLETFKKWYFDAEKNAPFDVTAFTLATVDMNSGVPSARVLLLKQFDEQGFTFYTNYLSRKGLELAAHPKASMVFYWPWTQKQIRVEGILERVPESVSDAYFASRPFESRVGACVSQQSQPLSDYDSFIRDCQKLSEDTKVGEISRPSHWGGFLLRPNSMEFWESVDYRWHKRTLFQVSPLGNWSQTLLYP